MEEIDVLKYCDDFKKKRIKEYLTSPKGIVNISGCCISLIPLIIPNRPIYVDFFVVSSLLMNLHSVVSNIKFSLNTSYQEHELLLQSDEYKECIQLYNTFISEMAMFLRSFGFKDSKELVFFILHFYETGLITSHMREYHNYRYGKDLLLEDFGVRAIDGRCVCRHTTSLFSDILNTYGIDACNLSVSVIHGKDLDKTNLKRIKYNHMVNGIVENGKKYIFDSTGYNFFGKCDREDLVKSCLDDSYMHLADNSCLFNTKSIKSYKNFRLAEFEELNGEELLEISSATANNIELNIKDLLDFALENKERIDRISFLVNKINPFSDEPIKKWFVK